MSVKAPLHIIYLADVFSDEAIFKDLIFVKLVALQQTKLNHEGNSRKRLARVKDKEERDEIWFGKKEGKPNSFFLPFYVLFI